MAPFGIHFGKKKKQPTGLAQETIIEENSNVNSHSLSGDDQGYGHSQVTMMSQGPSKPTRRWTLKKQKTLPPEPVSLPHDRRFLDSDYADPHYPAVTPAVTVLPMPGSQVGYQQTGPYQYQPTTLGHSRSDSGSSSSEGRGGAEHLMRHNTGRSQAHTILPHDSASNVHVQYVQQDNTGVNRLHGIVEEQSDIEYEHRPSSPVITRLAGPPVPEVLAMEPTGASHFQSSHEIGHGMTLHQGQATGGARLPPLEVTDAHGRRQKVQEVILDGSGTQEIPMPADGNVIFIVEEGVTLEVKDPVTGDYIPLDEYYARQAARTPPKPQERYIVVNGDASNIIVEDADGRLLHRGERVKSEYIRQRESDRVNSGSHRSHRTHESEERSEHYSQHIIDRKGNQITVHNSNPNPDLRLFFVDPKAGNIRQHTDHVVITTPPTLTQNWPTTVQVQVPHARRANSFQSSSSSSSSGRSSSSHAAKPRTIQAYEMDTTPEMSNLGRGFDHEGSARPSPRGLEMANVPPTGPYLASIPEGGSSLVSSSVTRSKSSKSNRSRQIVDVPPPLPEQFVVTGATPQVMPVEMPPTSTYPTEPSPSKEPSSFPTPTFAMPSPSQHASGVQYTPSITGQSIQPIPVHITGSQPSPLDARASNAVSFADNAIIMNPYPESVANTPGGRSRSIKTPATFRSGVQLQPQATGGSFAMAGAEGTPVVPMIEPQMTGMTGVSGVTGVPQPYITMPSPAIQPAEIITPTSSKGRAASVRSRPSIKSTKSNQSILKANSIRSINPIPEHSSPVPSVRSRTLGGEANWTRNSPSIHNAEMQGTPAVVPEPMLRPESPQEAVFHDAPEGAITLDSPPGSPNRAPSQRSRKTGNSVDFGEPQATGWGWGDGGFGASVSRNASVKSGAPMIERVGSPNGTITGGTPQVTAIPLQQIGMSPAAASLHMQPTGSPRSGRSRGLSQGGPPGSPNGSMMPGTFNFGGESPYNPVMPLEPQGTGAAGSEHSRRPSVASRLKTSISSRIPSPTRSGKRPEGSPSFINQPIGSDPLDMSGFDVPEDNKSSKRHTKNSGSLSFVQEPLETAPEPEPLFQPMETPMETPAETPAALEGEGAAGDDLNAFLEGADQKQEEEEEWGLPLKKGKKKGGAKADEEDDGGKKGKKGGGGGKKGKKK